MDKRKKGKLGQRRKKVPFWSFDIVLRPNRAGRSLTPWNNLLYALRRFQDIFPFLGGRSSYFGQTRIIVEEKLKTVNTEKFAFSLIFSVFDCSRFFFDKDPCWPKNKNCSYRETRKCPGTASMRRGNHSKASNLAQLSVWA